MSVKQSLARSAPRAFAAISNAETARAAVLRGTGAQVGPLAVTRVLAQTTEVAAAVGNITCRLYSAASGGVEMAEAVFDGLGTVNEWDSVSFDPPLPLLADEPLNATLQGAGVGDQDVSLYVETVATAR